MAEQKSIEDKIVSVKVSTLWAVLVAIVTMFFCGFGFYLSLKNTYEQGQAQVMGKLDTLDRRQEIKNIMQTNINNQTQDVFEQFNLRLQRIEGKVR